MATGEDMAVEEGKGERERRLRLDAATRANMHPLTIAGGLGLLFLASLGVGLALFTERPYLSCALFLPAWFVLLLWHRLALRRRRERIYARLSEESVVSEYERIFG